MGEVRSVAREVSLSRRWNERTKTPSLLRLLSTVIEVCPTVRTDPPRAHATRRSTDGFIIVYLRHPSSYGCSYYRIEIVKYTLCGGGGQKVRTRYVNAQKTLERHGKQ